jgi:hypothetical protein
MGGFGQSIGQLNQGSALTSSLNSGLPITSAMSSNGSTVYQAHYGLNSLGKSHREYQRDTVTAYQTHLGLNHLGKSGSANHSYNKPSTLRSQKSG